MGFILFGIALGIGVLGVDLAVSLGLDLVICVTLASNKADHRNRLTDNALKQLHFFVQWGKCISQTSDLCHRGRTAGLGQDAWKCMRHRDGNRETDRKIRTKVVGHMTM